MKLERARELYSDYAEGTLTPAMRLALEQHLAADPAARADYDEFAHVYALINVVDVPSVEVPLGFRAKVLELAALEQAKQARHSPSPLAWLQNIGRRRLAGALTAVTAVAGVFLATANHLFPQASIGPNIGIVASTIPTTIQSVTTANRDDGNRYHYFHVHLPNAASSAAVSAYVITSTDQITDPKARESDATPALRAPVTLASDEELQIPIGLPPGAPTAMTLNLYVSWKPTDGSAPGAQVVFTPVAGATPQASATATGDFYGALQTVAATDGVTVIADATNAPTQAITAPPAADKPLPALQSIAKQAGYSVYEIDPHTFQVYK